jgi:hypothetical protein
MVVAAMGTASSLLFGLKTPGKSNPFLPVLVARRSMPPNELRFSCGPKPVATPMNLFRWLHARQLQTLG